MDKVLIKMSRGQVAQFLLQLLMLRLANVSKCDFPLHGSTNHQMKCRSWKLEYGEMTLMGDRVADHTLGIARIIADDHLGRLVTRRQIARLFNWRLSRASLRQQHRKGICTLQST